MRRPARQIWAVVPVKTLADAKTRLTDASARARRRISLAMAEATIGALGRSSRLSGVVCVTADPAVRRAALSLGAVVAEDTDEGLNPAIVTGILAARAHGARHLLVLHADFARIDNCDLARLIETYETAYAARTDAIALVRCKDGAGTNAAMFAADGGFVPSFGERSFERHVAAARGAAVEAVAPGLALDIDRPIDLERAMRVGGAPRGVTDAFAAISSDMTPPTGAALFSEAARLRDDCFGAAITYSPKVFIPLTELCRDVCGYCAFAKPPSRVSAPYMALERVLDAARAGAGLGCKEALFTLGDKPELRYRAARDWLEAHGFASTLHYVAHAAEAVLRETGLLPHINAGVMTGDDIAMLRPHAASMGLMLETASNRLSAPGGPHFGSPDKDPAVRLATIEEAGRQRVPFTTGLLIGIGETHEERLSSLEAILALHERYGHIQELIIQNFLPKPGTRMAAADPAPLSDLVRTIAEARLMFGAGMSIQSPPNLNEGRLADLLGAGVNDWGGVSPLTPDYVNPEAPWPEIERLARETEAAGKRLVPRLTIYPDYVRDLERWADPKLARRIRDLSASDGLAREDDWRTGVTKAAPAPPQPATADARIAAILREISTGAAGGLGRRDIACLFTARGADFHAVCAAADTARAAANGSAATYVVNRNINYTNMCAYRCGFCAFSKGAKKHEGAEPAYLLTDDEIGRRVREAAERGASEVCLQGGIHPDFTGETYLAILNAVKRAAPAMHVHAFSPLEISHGAQTLGMAVDAYLGLLRDNGLGSLPGTAAEILDDRTRQVICPDKLKTDEWLDVIEAAHSVGLRTTATIMFGHVDDYGDWAIHLLRLRRLQARTGGLTEFVPLPFVAGEAPIYKRGQARPGPTFRESILMHAIARLVLAPAVPNIQASWVKLGPAGMARALAAGANDLGGTLMNESITRAAGASHGQEMTVADMRALADGLGRRLVRRTTLYERYDGPRHERRAERSTALQEV